MLLPPRVVNRLDRELNLTPQQKKSIEEIIERRHERLIGVMTGVRPQLRKEIDEANAEIERVLTPEQRVKFSRMRIRLHGPGPHGHDGPPPMHRRW